MLSREDQDLIRGLNRTNHQVLEALRRIEAILIAAHNKIPVEGCDGMVIAVDGGQLTTQEMLTFVDSQLVLVGRSFTQGQHVRSKLCPNEPNYWYMLPIDRDYVYQPLSYKEACVIRDVLFGLLQNWLAVSREAEQTQP